ncbi:MAG: hypothetical protein IT305_03900 [Chloroflexi bacterium]|nr:hypothetical protein [Chloroflexota bacterium]
MTAQYAQQASTAPVLFDDLYVGQRWRYGLPSRHAVHYLQSPAGAWILFSERPSDDPQFPFGTLDFARKLPEDIAHQLDLVLVAELDGMPGH